MYLKRNFSGTSQALRFGFHLSLTNYQLVLAVRHSINCYVQYAINMYLHYQRLVTPVCLFQNMILLFGLIYDRMVLNLPNYALIS
jgi:hypothetical protein